MTTYIRGYHPPVHFEINGLLTDFSLNTIIDGFRELNAGQRVLGFAMTQRVDGSVTSPVGVTTVELIKISTAGAITIVTTLSLVQGGGANARAVTSTVATEALRALPINTRLAIRLTAVQLGGEDLSISVFLGA